MTQLNAFEEAERERLLREQAKVQAEEIGLQNQARIETAREDLSRRATGTTNYGQAVEQPVADYLARNISQADIARQQSLARGEGESAKAHLDRLAMDPNSALNRVAMEEQTFRQTQHYAEREKAIREYLARGAQNVRDPNLQQMASEFVMSYPREYAQIRAEMRGGAAAPAPAQTPEERRAALAGASNVMSGIVSKELSRRLGRDLSGQEQAFVRALQNADANNVPPENIEQLKQQLVDYGGLEVRDDGSVRGVGDKGSFAASLYTRLTRIRDNAVGKQYGGLSGQDVNRARSAATRDPEGFQRFYDAADQAIAQGDRRSKDIIAAELYNQQLRRQGGFDSESRAARQSDVARSRAIEAITSRAGGDPAMVDRAIKNWNSRNPDNPLLREDFGIASAGQDVTARPGEVVEVDNIRSVNPRNVSPGSILVDASGAARMARRPDGSSYGQPVLQDRNSGFYFPDPDKYATQAQFDGAMSRQDRVNMRQAIMQSGNSMLATEQRRLEAARRAAASGIPEIREAGLKEVNDLERELHWQYISEAASLAGPAPTGGRQEYEIAAAPGRPERAEKPVPPITLGDVNARLAEIMSAEGAVAHRDLRSRLRGMTEQQQRDEIYNIMEAERKPYGSTGLGPLERGPAIVPADSVSGGPAVQQRGPAIVPADSVSGGPAVQRGMNANQVAPVAMAASDNLISDAWPTAMAIVQGSGTPEEKAARIDKWAEDLYARYQADNISGADIQSAIGQMAATLKRRAGFVEEEPPAMADVAPRSAPLSASPDAISAATAGPSYRRQGYATSQPTRYQ